MKTSGLSRFRDALMPGIGPERLAALRLLIGGFALWNLWVSYQGWLGVASSPASLFAPVGVASWLSGPVAPEVFRATMLLTLGAGVFFVLGFRFAYFGPLFAAGYLAVASYRNSWSMIFHSENLLVLHLVLLATTPAANAWSLDAWLRNHFPAARRIWHHGAWRLYGESERWRYGWPCVLMGAVTAAAYWVAGVAKVTGPLGWGWASGEALRTYILRDGLRKELLSDGANSAVWWIEGHTGILTAIAVVTLVLELGGPLTILRPRLARAWAFGIWMMHLGILGVMGIEFLYPLSGIAFASFFPWERLNLPRRASLAARAPERLLSVRPERPDGVGGAGMAPVVPAHRAGCPSRRRESISQETTREGSERSPSFSADSKH